MNEMRLNLGAGARRLSGDWVNVDKVPHENVDVVHDLNVFPYPFAGDSADCIYMHHVLEHLREPYDVMVECHRILKPGGSIEVVVPHKNHLSAYDIAHPRLFTERSMCHLADTGKDTNGETHGEGELPSSSLQGNPLFRIAVCRVKRLIPTPWGYLSGVNIYRNAIGIGVRAEIKWVLTK